MLTGLGIAFAAMVCTGTVGGAVLTFIKTVKGKGKK